MLTIYRVKSLGDCIWKFDYFGNKWLLDLVSDHVIDPCGWYSGEFRQVLMHLRYYPNRPEQVMDWEAVKSLSSES